MRTIKTKYKTTDELATEVAERNRKATQTLDVLLKLSVGLASKLGSIVVHADEMLSPSGHDFDKITMIQLLRDSEVMDWITKMDKMALLPKKR